MQLVPGGGVEQRLRSPVVRFRIDVANGAFRLSSPRHVLLEDVPPRKASGVQVERRNPPRWNARCSGSGTLARIAAVALSLCAASVAAQSANTGNQDSREDGQSVLEVVEVVAPLSLDAVAWTKGDAQAATAKEIAAARPLGLTELLNGSAASVSINEAQGNPLQADLRYRGFVGSPLLGLPQGIAVYQDAVRLNEPFGDTVQWALLPPTAVDAVLLMPGSNPLFGLNALGGAISLRTKDGFAHPGFDAKALAGSFGRRAVAAQAGDASERLGYYGMVSTLREDGWREYSPTRADAAFAKLSWRGAACKADFSLQAADTDLTGNGAAPVQLLRRQRSAVFTRPDRTWNALAQFNATAQRDWSATLAVGANLYLRNSDIDTYNGDDSDIEACENDPKLLCLEDDPAHDADGGALTADQRLDATINRTRTAQRSRGFAAQARWRPDGAGQMRHRWLVGASVDASSIDFSSNTELGWLDETRQAVSSGVFLADTFTDLVAELVYSAVYVASTLSLSRKTRLNVGARYNRAAVTLRDGLGTALDGDHRFSRVNPTLGVDYRATPALSLYASYSESNRAPSPVELTCADENDPCRLPNAFLADPPLKQVVARTVEAGLRGSTGAVDWRFAAFATRSDDDILFISAGRLTSDGYFDNVGATLRRGVELSLAGAGRLRWFLRYALLDATFRDPFSVPSANHPNAERGRIRVPAGARLPLIPRHQLKVGIGAELSPRLGIDAELIHASAQHLRGDEANLTTPLDGYAVVNLRLDYAVRPWISVFAKGDNVLNRRYATFGAFGEADEVLGDEFDNPRFATPAPPRAGWLGIEVRR